MLVETLATTLILVEQMKQNLYMTQPNVSIEESQQIEREIEWQYEFEEFVNQQQIELSQLNTEYTYTDYRQTFYSVVEDSEKSLGAMYDYTSSKIKNIDNIMHFEDNDLGYLPVYAIDMNAVYASGLNEKGTPNIYGSVIEVKFDDDTIINGLVLDSCGACTRDNKIDLWVYNNDYSLDTKNVSFRYVRYGWDDYIAE